MKTTTYKCDRCGRESTDEGHLDLVKVAVGVQRTEYGSYRDAYHLTNERKDLSADWCKDCCIEVGFRTSRKVDKVIQDTSLSLEDIIREFIAEEVESQLDNKG